MFERLIKKETMPMKSVRKGNGFGNRVLAWKMHCHIATLGLKKNLIRPTAKGLFFSNSSNSLANLKVQVGLIRVVLTARGALEVSPSRDDPG